MVDIAIISLGAGLMVAVAGACYKAASLRADLNEKWRMRVPLMNAGLTVMAADRLIDLHGDVSERLVQRRRFDPAKVIADPAHMVAMAKEFLLVMRVLRRIEWQFRWLLRLGPVLFLTLVVLEVGTGAVFGHLGHLWTHELTYRIGLYSCGGGFVVLLVCFGLYAYLQHALSSAEIFASPGMEGD